ncbi:hypothetical protein [Bradyrhizobium nitroreducens]|nr:hypothetical protein [Bradyrhizobium nitroreducens]
MLLDRKNIQRETGVKILEARTVAVSVAGTLKIDYQPAWRA